MAKIMWQYQPKSNKIKKMENKECKNNHQATASGGAVYGLGFIGAAIYFK